MILRDLRREQDDLLLRSLYDDVLEPSFDADELIDLAGFEHGLCADDDPRLIATVAVEDDGSVLGGIVGLVYESVNVLLLAYLAVRPDVRGRGTGAELVRRVVPEWFASADVAIAVGEVHDPRFWPDDPADARLRLYDRLGGRVLGVPFVQPRLREGLRRVRGFLLLVFAIDPHVCVVRDGHDAIRADLVARFVRRYFEDSEGVRAPYDPELARLLEVIERDDAIPLLPVAQYERVPSLDGALAAHEAPEEEQEVRGPLGVASD